MAILRFFAEDGDVFGWGNSEYNQFDCVAPGSAQIATPLHLPVREIVGKTKRVASGGSACALVNGTTIHFIATLYVHVHVVVLLQLNFI